MSSRPGTPVKLSDGRQAVPIGFDPKNPCRPKVQVIGDLAEPVEDGAESILWAARIGNDGPTAGFFRDGAPLAW